MSTQQKKILIVDDEQGVRRSLEGVLKDEGFCVRTAEDGLVALKILEEYRPDLVFMDIWLPGIDGIETLKRIKEAQPAVAVIMISGHATIPTAVMATRLGAFDFIEKPLDLNLTVNMSRRALGLEKSDTDETQAGLATAQESLRIGESRNLNYNRVAFQNQKLRGRAQRQRTLSGSAVLYGQGLHSGRKSGLVLEPLPPDSGIHFVGVSETAVVPAHLDFVQSTGYATTIRLGATHAATIEHLMSALHAYGISNLLVKCNGEVPVLDGSASEFCRLFEETGVEEQEGEWYAIKVPKVVEYRKEREFIRIEPSESFSVCYSLDYPLPVGKQEFCFELDSPESYKREIAPCRTFGFVRDIGKLQQAGLALGGRFDNFVLIGPEGAVNTELRFPDELVRHKVLDAIGDLYLLGRPLQGKVTAHMTGHSDNVELLKLVQGLMLG